MMGVTLEAEVAMERPLNPPYCGSPRCRPIVRALGPAVAGVRSPPDRDSPGGIGFVHATSTVATLNKSPKPLALQLILSPPDSPSPGLSGTLCALYVRDRRHHLAPHSMAHSALARWRLRGYP